MEGQGWISKEEANVEEAGSNDVLETIAQVYGEMMDDRGDGEFEMPLANLTEAAQALGVAFSAEEEQQVRLTLDNGTGFVEFEPFAQVMQLKMGDSLPVSDNRAEKVREAFGLFKKDQSLPITLKDLRRISKQVKDDATDQDLMAMLTLFGKDTVDLADFDRILKEARIML